MDRESIFNAMGDAGYEAAQASCREQDGGLYVMARHQNLPVLLIFGAASPAFEGQPTAMGPYSAAVCPLTARNAAALRTAFPYTAPVSPSGHDVTFGLGDRLGLVTGAHIQALSGTSVFPVLAQQSKRELSLTGRTYRSMLDDVTWQVFEAGYEGGYAADGDHLKTMDEIRAAIEDGATMITLDCSEHIDNAAASLSPEEAAAQCAARLDPALITRWNSTYAGKTFSLGEQYEVHFDPAQLPAMYLIYSGALDFAEQVYHSLLCKSPHHVALEISIDETETETSPAAHYFVARELQSRGVQFESMAPRFCGEFQKGVDYIGDPQRFQVEFAVHAQIAKALGYRISVHSGSDKFAVFPYVGRLSNYRFHLKTSGTSWVEAVRVIAACNPALFRRMVHYACNTFQEARAYYHVSGQVEKVPQVDDIPDADLPRLLDEIDTRQVLHITYGCLLQAKDEQGKPLFRTDIYDTLRSHKAELDAVISAHIRRHLVCLGVV